MEKHLVTDEMQITGVSLKELKTKVQQLTGEVADSNGYRASTLQGPIDIVNLHLLENEAKLNMERGPWGYLREGSEDEYTLRRNVDCWNEKRILPKMLQNIEYQGTTTELFGIPLSMPVIQAPIAAQKLAHVNGENDTAKGVAKVGTIFTLSAYGSTLIEEAAAIAPGAPQFFQLYMSKNDDFNRFILQKAVDSGVKAIVLTADSTVGGYREEDVVNKFIFPFPLANLAAFSSAQSEVGSSVGSTLQEIYGAAKQALEPEDIRKIKEFSGGLPVILKGVQDPDDVEMAIQAGVDGIWVSNHGGRQLDGAPGSFEVLPEIAKAVNKRVPIIFDSGIRRGTHVFKALAAGADVVALGRPVLYGLNLGGSDGVASVYEHLNKEFKIAMQLAGTRTIEEVKRAKMI